MKSIAKGLILLTTYLVHWSYSYQIQMSALTIQNINNLFSRCAHTYFVIFISINRNHSQPAVFKEINLIPSNDIPRLQWYRSAQLDREKPETTRETLRLSHNKAGLRRSVQLTHWWSREQNSCLPSPPIMTLSGVRSMVPRKP